MTIRNDEVNIQSSGSVREEQIYVLPDGESIEYHLWEEKQNIRNQAQTETHNDPENTVSELQQFHKPPAPQDTLKTTQESSLSRIMT